LWRWRPPATIRIAGLVAISTLSASALLVNPDAFVDVFRDPAAHAPTSGCVEVTASIERPRYELRPAERKTLYSKEYDTAITEIQSRINLHHSLFALKFTIVGAILAALFSLLHKNAVEDFEGFVRKRRAAVFFSAALFACVVIDAQLRNNIDMVVTLGTWIRCGITQFVPADGLVWELFLQAKMNGGVFPILRNMSHLLTALLYGIMLVMYFVMARGCYAATRQVFWASEVLFVFLAAIGASYGVPWYVSLGTASVGMGSVALAYRGKRHQGDVGTVVSNFADYLERLLANNERDRNALAEQGFSETGLAVLRGRVARRRVLLAPPDRRARITELDRVEIQSIEEALWEWYFRCRAAVQRQLGS
jgi:hypothetical protein